MNNKTSDKLLTVINDAILEKKGVDLINLNLEGVDNAMARHFVICHANNAIQVRVIAENIERKTREVLREKPFLKEGHENAQWVLIDYFDVVVHVFQEEYRAFYNLEELWGDAKILNITDDGKVVDEQ